MLLVKDLVSQNGVLLSPRLESALKRKLYFPGSRMGQMDQAVEERRGHLGVAQRVSSFAEVEVGGDDGKGWSIGGTRSAHPHGDMSPEIQSVIRLSSTQNWTSPGAGPER